MRDISKRERQEQDKRNEARPQVIRTPKKNEIILNPNALARVQPHFDRSAKPTLNRMPDQNFYNEQDFAPTFGRTVSSFSIVKLTISKKTLAN